jgi:hypothetical protein
LGGAKRRACTVLTLDGCPIAPRTYYMHLRRPPSARALSDAAVTARIAAACTPDERGRRAPESLYGATKTWAWLNLTRPDGAPPKALVEITWRQPLARRPYRR